MQDWIQQIQRRQAKKEKKVSNLTEADLLKYMVDLLDKAPKDAIFGWERISETHGCPLNAKGERIRGIFPNSWWDDAMKEWKNGRR